MSVLGDPVDIGAIELETYVTGALTDHLTPWKGCYRTTQLIRAAQHLRPQQRRSHRQPVNPPGNPKAHYFAGPEPVADPDQWRAGAERRAGTWWEDWGAWISARSGDERKAPSTPAAGAIRRSSRRRAPTSATWCRLSTERGTGRARRRRAGAAVIWAPTPEFAEPANVTAFIRWLENTRGLQFAGYRSCGIGR